MRWGPILHVRIDLRREEVRENVNYREAYASKTIQIKNICSDRFLFGPYYLNITPSLYIALFIVNIQDGQSETLRTTTEQ